MRVFLLVFIILGVSMWGISEIFHRAEESKQNKKVAELTGLNAARRAVFNYALVAPERVNIESRAGRYSALMYENGTAMPSIPYRYFGLPCADLMLDSNLDSVSDPFNDSGVISPCDFVDLSRQGLGRLPWRSLSDAASGGAYRYIHGVGNQRLSDSFGNLFWYFPSPNLVHSNNALNPHWIMRRTSDWITIKQGEQVVAKNVAAVVVAPGERVLGNGNNLRVPEDGVNDTGGRDVQNVVRAYLESGVLGDVIDPLLRVVRPSLTVSVTAEENVNNFGAPQSNDKITYITREELADIAGPGVRSLTEGAEDIHAQIAGEDDFFGVQEMMEAHFQRYHSMPAPAVYNSGNAESVRRTPNLSSVGQGDCVLNCALPLVGSAIVVQGRTLRVGSVAGVAGSSITVEALLPAENIRQVYLQRGAYLSAGNRQGFNDGLPPYNLALYEMDTALNTEPLETNYVRTLIDNGFYPFENLFGVSHNYLNTAIDSPAVSVIGNPGAALRQRVYVKSPSTSANLRFGTQGVLSGTDVPMALAEPTRAYLRGADNEAVYDLLNLPGVSTRDMPPYAVQVQLPVGTRLIAKAAGNSNVSLIVPSGLQANVVYDQSVNGYRLLSQLRTPIEWFERSTRLLTVSLVLPNLAVLAGDSGFLPMDNRAVEYISTDSSVFLNDVTPLSTITIAGKDQTYAAPGGPIFSNVVPISDVPVDLELYTDHRLALVPFPPPGRPLESSVSTALVSLPSPMFINYVKSGTSERRFVLPAGSQIIYSRGMRQTLDIGVDFTFPHPHPSVVASGSRCYRRIIIQFHLAGRLVGSYPNRSGFGNPSGNFASWRLYSFAW